MLNHLDQLTLIFVYAALQIGPKPFRDHAILSRRPVGLDRSAFHKLQTSYNFLFISLEFFPRLLL